VCGSGLSALALILQESGIQVSGSDRQASPLLHRLEAAGIEVTVGHRAENVTGAELVVRSSAVLDDNLEVRAARAAGIPVLKRSDFLRTFFAEHIIRERRTIAVAGTHGKTTTTAMIATVLAALGQDPSYIIGGVPSNLGSNAHAGQGAHFVIEADEYDRMFLGLNPWIAVVTYVEHDHPDCYPTPQDFFETFRAFVGRIQPGGVLLACADEPGAARLLSQSHLVEVRRLDYGLLKPGKAERVPDYNARGMAPNAQGGFSFDAYHGEKRLAEVLLQVPGVHNVRNALAALAVADLLNLPMQDAANALAGFQGAGRRFELRGEINGVSVIDDYAHHPTEILATLAAARARFPQRRIWAVWQPHTYSRTRSLMDRFAQSFQDADAVLVTEIYAAREAPPPDGFSGRVVAGEIAAARPGRLALYAASLVEARDLLLAHLEPGDVVLVLSAGDADRISAELLERLRGGSSASSVD